MAKGWFSWAEAESGTYLRSWLCQWVSMVFSDGHKPRWTDEPAQHPHNNCSSTASRKTLVKCLQVMPVPTYCPASHVPLKYWNQFLQMQNSISNGALCRRLILKTFDTTVCVTSDSGKVRSSLRNFSVTFSLHIFNVDRGFSEVTLKCNKIGFVLGVSLSVYMYTQRYIYYCRIYNWNVNSLYFYFQYCLPCASGICKNQLKSCKSKASFNHWHP